MSPHFLQSLNLVWGFVRQRLLRCGRLALVKKDILSLLLSRRMIVRCHLKRGPIVFKAEILWEYNI
jgi:hypothetical protein